MHKLVYIKDISRLENTSRQHAELLSGGWTVVTDCPHVHYEVSCNYSAKSVFMGQYLTGEDFDQIEQMLADIRDGWFDCVRDRLFFEDGDHLRVFWMLLQHIQ